MSSGFWEPQGSQSTDLSARGAESCSLKTNFLAFLNCSLGISSAYPSTVPVIVIVKENDKRRAPRRIFVVQLVDGSQGLAGVPDVRRCESIWIGVILSLVLGPFEFEDRVELVIVFDRCSGALVFAFTHGQEAGGAPDPFCDGAFQIGQLSLRKQLQKWNILLLGLLLVELSRTRCTEAANRVFVVNLERILGDGTVTLVVLSLVERAIFAISRRSRTRETVAVPRLKLVARGVENCLGIVVVDCLWLLVVEVGEGEESGDCATADVAGARLQCARNKSESFRAKYQGGVMVYRIE